jgi:hypothetical protein
MKKSLLTLLLAASVALPFFSEAHLVVYSLTGSGKATGERKEASVNISGGAMFWDVETKEGYIVNAFSLNNRKLYLVHAIGGQSAVATVKAPGKNLTLVAGGNTEDDTKPFEQIWLKGGNETVRVAGVTYLVPRSLAGTIRLANDNSDNEDLSDVTISEASVQATYNSTATAAAVQAQESPEQRLQKIVTALRAKGYASAVEE